MWKLWFSNIISFLFNFWLFLAIIALLKHKVRTIHFYDTRNLPIWTMRLIWRYPIIQRLILILVLKVHLEWWLWNNVSARRLVTELDITRLLSEKVITIRVKLSHLNHFTFLIIIFLQQSILVSSSVHMWVSLMNS